MRGVWGWSMALTGEMGCECGIVVVGGVECDV